MAQRIRRPRWRERHDELPNRPSCSTGAAHGIGRATAMALARTRHAAGADRPRRAGAGGARPGSEGRGRDRRRRRGRRDRPRRLDPGGRRHRGRARADRGPGRLRRHRHAHPGPRARHVDAPADARGQPGRRGPVDRGGPAGDDRAGTGPYRRRRQRGRLSRLPLDDLVLRVEGRPDRLPRGPAARPAPARRDGDHRLPGLRPHPDVHGRPLSAPGQDDRARRGRPAPRPRGRAPAAQLRLPLEHADRPGHPEVHARLVLRPADATGSAPRRCTSSSERPE